MDDLNQNKLNIEEKEGWALSLDFATQSPSFQLATSRCKEPSRRQSECQSPKVRKSRFCL